MKDITKKFVVFANCQSGALAKTLLENDEFSALYSWEFLEPVHNLSNKDVPDVIHKVKNTDLFLYQPVAHNPNRPKQLTSNFLLSKLKRSAVALSFPSIYFDGYFPHLQTFNGYFSVLNLVHDYIIAYCYAIGLKKEDAFRLIRQENLYPKELSIKLTVDSIKSLRIRELNEDIDINISDYILRNYWKSKLFNQFNHPKRPIFRFIAKSILQRLNIEQYHVEEIADSYLDAISTPIYISTHTNLNLAFPEDFNLYVGTGNKKLSLENVISGFFDFYRQYEKSDIKTHVSKIKPFIPAIVESQI